MSSSSESDTYSEYENSFSSDDTQPPPRFDASKLCAEYENEVHALEEELFGDLDTEAESEPNDTATSQHLDSTVAPHPDNEGMDDESIQLEGSLDQHLFEDEAEEEKNTDEVVAGKEPQASGNDQTTTEIEPKLYALCPEENNTEVPYQPEAIQSFRLDSSEDIDVYIKEGHVEFDDEEWDAFEAGRPYFGPSKKIAPVPIVPQITNNSQKISLSKEKTIAVVEPPKVPEEPIRKDVSAGFNNDAPAEPANIPSDDENNPVFQELFGKVPEDTPVESASALEKHGFIFDITQVDWTNGFGENNIDFPQVQTLPANAPAEQCIDTARADWTNGFGENNLDVPQVPSLPASASEEQNFDASQADWTNGFGENNLEAPQVQNKSTHVPQEFGWNVPQIQPVSGSQVEPTFANQSNENLNINNTTPIFGHSMQARDNVAPQSQDVSHNIVDTFMDIYRTSSGDDRAYLNERLLDMWSGSFLNLAPVGIFRTLFQTLMTMIEGPNAAGSSAMPQMNQPKLHQTQPNGTLPPAPVYNQSVPGLSNNAASGGAKPAVAQFTSQTKPDATATRAPVYNRGVAGLSNNTSGANPPAAQFISQMQSNGIPPPAPIFNKGVPGLSNNAPKENPLKTQFVSQIQPNATATQTPIYNQGVPGLGLSNNAGVANLLKAQFVSQTQPDTTATQAPIYNHGVAGLSGNVGANPLKSQFVSQIQPNKTLPPASIYNQSIACLSNSIQGANPLEAQFVSQTQANATAAQTPIYKQGVAGLSNNTANGGANPLEAQFVSQTQPNGTLPPAPMYNHGVAGLSNNADRGLGANPPAAQFVSQTKPDTTTAQAPIYNQSMPTHASTPQDDYVPYTDSLPAFNEFMSTFDPPLLPNSSTVSTTDRQHLQQEIDGTDVMNQSNLAPDFDAGQIAESFADVPGFDDFIQSQLWHIPALSNNANSTHTTANFPNDESFAQGYSLAQQTEQSMNPQQTNTYHPTSYVPPITHLGHQRQFVQGSSQGGTQIPVTQNHPPNFNQPHATSPPPTTPTNSNTNKKRKRRGRGSEAAERPATRRRVSSSPFVSNPSPAQLPVVVSSSVPGPATLAITRENNSDVIDMFFEACTEEDQPGSICIYQCANAGERCGMFLSGKDKRNRYRHLATHAQNEEYCVEAGFISVEQTSLMTRLSKVVVTCALPGCDFQKEVWRTDKVREQHEKDAHYEMYELRRQRRERNKKIKGDSPE